MHLKKKNDKDANTFCFSVRWSTSRRVFVLFSLGIAQYTCFLWVFILAAKRCGCFALEYQRRVWCPCTLGLVSRIPSPKTERPVSVLIGGGAVLFSWMFFFSYCHHPLVFCSLKIQFPLDHVISCYFFIFFRITLSASLILDWDIFQDEILDWYTIILYKHFLCAERCFQWDHFLLQNPYLFFSGMQNPYQVSGFHVFYISQMHVQLPQYNVRHRQHKACQNN